MTNNGEDGNKKNQEKKKTNKEERKTKNERFKKNKVKQKRMRLGKRSHQILKILKKRWLTKLPTTGAFATWLGLLTNKRTVGLSRTNLKA